MHACSVTSVKSDSLQPYGLKPFRLLCPWDPLDNNSGVGYHALLQGCEDEMNIYDKHIYGAWHIAGDKVADPPY